MLSGLILTVHLIVCLFLIVIVLIQGGKGAEMGAAFGGSSQTLFGARGAATFFSKLTTGAAIVFMITSLVLAVVTYKSGSVVNTAPAPAQQKSAIPQDTSGPVQGTQPVQTAPAGQQSQSVTIPVKPAAPAQQQTAPAPAK